MQDPVSYVVVLEQEEDLGFVYVTAVGEGMDDAVGIMIVCRPDVLGVRDGFRVQTFRGTAGAGVRTKGQLLSFLIILNN